MCANRRVCAHFVKRASKNVFLYSLYKKFIDKYDFYGTIHIVRFIPICEVTVLSEKSNQTDTSLDELVLAARQGDDAAFARLAAALMPAMRARAAASACADLDADDLVQEGMLALLSAVHTYQIGAEASFMTFAGVCIRNRMISALRKVSGSKSVRTQDTVPLDADVPAPELTVEAYGDLREECETLLRRVDTKLSSNERTVLYLFLSGLSYREIAERLGKTPKSVDNALQRVRHKLKAEQF